MERLKTEEGEETQLPTPSWCPQTMVSSYVNTDVSFLLTGQATKNNKKVKVGDAVSRKPFSNRNTEVTLSAVVVKCYTSL